MQSICFADSASGYPYNNSNEYSTSKQKSEPQGKFCNIVTTLVTIVTTIVTTTVTYLNSKQLKDIQEEIKKFGNYHMETLRSLTLTKTEWEINKEKLNTAKADLATCRQDLSKTDFALGTLKRNLSQEKAAWLYNRALKILHFNWIGNKLTEEQWKKAIDEIDLCEQNLMCKYTGWGCKPCKDNYYGNVYGLLFPNNNGK